MKQADFESMMRGMTEARAFTDGRARDGFVVHMPVEVSTRTRDKDLEDHP